MNKIIDWLTAHPQVGVTIKFHAPFITIAMMKEYKWVSRIVSKEELEKYIDYVTYLLYLLNDMYRSLS